MAAETPNQASRPDNPTTFVSPVITEFYTYSDKKVVNGGIYTVNVGDVELGSLSIGPKRNNFDWQGYAELTALKEQVLFEVSTYLANNQSTSPFAIAEYTSPDECIFNQVTVSLDKTPTNNEGELFDYEGSSWRNPNEPDPGQMGLIFPKSHVLTAEAVQFIRDTHYQKEELPEFDAAELANQINTMSNPLALTADVYEAFPRQGTQVVASSINQ